MIFLAELECDAKKPRASPIARVQITVTNRRVDLIEEVIDIAVRVRERLDTDQALQVKQIGGSKRILVAAPQLFETEKPPDAPAELVRFPILYQQEQQRPTTWTLTTESGEEETVHLTPKLATGEFGILRPATAGDCAFAVGELRPELASGELIHVLPK
jgi:DNA-binding transcriptional LysR family regulator